MNDSIEFFSADKPKNQQAPGQKLEDCSERWKNRKTNTQRHMNCTAEGMIDKAKC